MKAAVAPTVQPRPFATPQAAGPGPPARSEARSADPGGAALFREYQVSGDVALRNRLVLQHQRLVYYVARRFRPSGNIVTDDLIQVGFLGLIQAIDRYDPNAGATFVTFALPTMIGVIKHHLRDEGWALKAPRRLRELGLRLRRARAHLENELGRSPTIEELVEATGIAEEQLLEAIDVERSYQPVSLDAPILAEPGQACQPLRDTLGANDQRLADLEQREVVAGAISRLNRRQQTIIRERFFREASQSEVAEKLGISQMHVSRLERDALCLLRGFLTSLRPSYRRDPRS
jgi:RNA polymerase sigma-B factor